MALTKQSKTLNKAQIDAVRGYLRDRRNGLRNDTMFLLSVKAGLRAKEISNLKWTHVVNASGEICDAISLPNSASKGLKSGREIPLHKELKKNLAELLKQRQVDLKNDFVITSERSSSVSPQVVVNFFHNLYKKLGLNGCSSHSGRRTFITDVSRKISSVGGSIRDVQYLAGHSNMQTTMIYIEGSESAKRDVVNLI